MPERDINAIALLGVQVLIAYIERLNPRMRSVVVKLFKGRSTK